MFKKIFLLIIIFLSLLIFSFGYEHNEEVSYYEIENSDYIQYLKSFNSAIDIWNLFVERFNTNNENLVKDLKNYINVDFRVDSEVGNKLLIGVNIFNQIVKLLLLPINALIRLISYVFQQFSLGIYILTSYLLWASGIRSVLIWLK